MEKMAGRIQTNIFNYLEEWKAGQFEKRRGKFTHRLQ
jgi:hypothetical protein